jgi:hypothetical protein
LKERREKKEQYKKGGKKEFNQNDIKNKIKKQKLFGTGFISEVGNC